MNLYIQKKLNDIGINDIKLFFVVAKKFEICNMDNDEDDEDSKVIIYRYGVIKVIKNILKDAFNTDIDSNFLINILNKIIMDYKNDIQFYTSCIKEKLINENIEFDNLEKIILEVTKYFLSGILKDNPINLRFDKTKYKNNDYLGKDCFLFDNLLTKIKNIYNVTNSEYGCNFNNKDEILKFDNKKLTVLIEIYCEELGTYLIGLFNKLVHRINFKKI